MRYLVISDVHANLEALEAVLADVGPFDATLCLGDLVGYGPNPNECVNTVRELPRLTCLVGNHDLAALGALDLSEFNSYARRAAEWTDAELGTDVRAFLMNLEPAGALGDFALAHASPRDPVWEYMETARQGPPNFALFDGPACFVGHTHVPRVFTEGNGQSNVTMPKHGDEVPTHSGGRKIVNPGGVGQPRDGDPRAAYALLDTETGIVSYCRVEYPVEMTQSKILAAGLPPPLAYRLSAGV